jgi:aspartyl aminopeptidase
MMASTPFSRRRPKPPTRRGCHHQTVKGFDANSEFTAKVLALLNNQRIAWQTHSPRVKVSGGGTIGALFSTRDRAVIDIGVPLLSMRSPY